MGYDQGMGTTANYTLPGIMQYLQSQFTQVERNRLQGELERSSLKLKIIELENERNALYRKTEKLQLTVDQLTQQLDQIKCNNNNNNSNNNTQSNGSIDTVNDKGNNSPERQTIKNDKQSDAEVEQILGGLHSLDASKLVHARKFLKSATNEILYLLKTPTVEIENTSSVGGVTGISSLTGGDNYNDMFFNYNSLSSLANGTGSNGFSNNKGDDNHDRNDDDNDTSSTTSSNLINSINFVSNKGELQSEPQSNNNVENNLNDILAAPFKSNADSQIVESDTETITRDSSVEKEIEPLKESKLNASTDKENDGDDDDDNDDDDDDDDEDEDFDIDDDEFEDDDEDDDDAGDDSGVINRNDNEGSVTASLLNEKEIESQHGKHTKEKLLHLLKKSPNQLHKGVVPELPVKVDSDVSNLELKGGRLYSFYDKSNVVKIYDDLSGKGHLIKEIKLPDASTIIDIITGENIIFIATTNSLIAHSTASDTETKIVKQHVSPKTVDLDSNKILLVTDSTIEIFEIDFEKNEFVPLKNFNYKFEGILKKAKFVKNNPLFDISVLSSNTLYLYSTKDESSQLKLYKSLPLSEYHEWLLTSAYMILRFDHGLFLFDFNECSEFKSISLPSFPDSEHASNSISEIISPCVDDDTLFYITRCSTNENLTKASGIYELRLFKVGEMGDISEVKKIVELPGTERCCVGKIGNNFNICITKGNQVQLHSIS